MVHKNILKLIGVLFIFTTASTSDDLAPSNPMDNNPDNNYVDETSLAQYNSTALQDVVQPLYESKARQLEIAAQARRQNISSIHPQVLYRYRLYNDKFQAVFPGNPYQQDIPHEFKRQVVNDLSIQYKGQFSQTQLNNMANAIWEVTAPYIYNDNNHHISYTALSAPSQLEHKNYMWTGMKNMLDTMIQQNLRANNQDLLDFSSTIDRYNDTYIAIFTSSYYQNNQTVYSSKKLIYYKDKIYSWQMSYLNQDDIAIFKSNQKYCKVIK